MSFLSSEVPICAPATSPVSIAAALADGSVFPEVSQKITAGQVTGFVSAFNGQGRRVDVLSRSFGLFAVISGLAISAGTGLSLNVATGYALIDGVVEVAAQAYVVPASQARIWMWVRQNGTIVHTLTSSAPSAKSLYIGSLVTSGSAITSVDSVDGVQCLKGGIVYRQTSDTGYPNASGPSGQILVCKTLGGTYLWNGAAWSSLDAKCDAVVLHPRDAVLGIARTEAITGAVETEIHFSLCKVDAPGIYEYKGISIFGGDTEFTGSSKNIKVWAVKAVAGTGAPGAVANTSAHVLTMPGSTINRWNDFAYSGGTAILDLRDSPYFWVASQVAPSGFSAGTISVALGVDAGLSHSARRRDFVATRSGTALSYSAGLPIAGGVVDTASMSFTEPGAVDPFSNTSLCHALWSVGLKRIG